MSHPHLTHLIAKSKATIKGFKKWHWTSWTLSFVLSWVALTTIAVTSFGTGRYALSVLSHHKMSDTWAIMFLELEHHSHGLAERLMDELRLPHKAEFEVDILFKEGKGPQIVIDSLPASVGPEDLGVASLEDLKNWDDLRAVKVGGRVYLAQLGDSKGVPGDATRLTYWPIDSKIFAEVIGPGPSSGGAVYVVNRDGQLLHSTSPDITQGSFGTRPLVQKFIESPLRQGQMEFVTDSGEASYGFFFEIPMSNIVLFSEVEKAKALADIKTIQMRFILLLVGSLLVVLLLLQILMRRITLPLREAASLAQKIGSGDFSHKMVTKGFGELRALSSAFNTMITGLQTRDISIRELMKQQATKVRLEGELEIARNIQQNLLPSWRLPPDCGSEIAAVYLPATECAGDWYSYSHNPHSKETIVAIVDVSGHGTGSSMFTAVIAGIFDQHRHRSGEHFDMAEFASDINGVLHRLGRLQWHATMLMMRHIPGKGEAEFLFAGHPPAIILDPERGDESVKLLVKGSQPLGVEPSFPIVTTTLPFPKGSAFVFYTDGLTEARNPAGRQYGARSLKNCLRKGIKNSPKRLVDHIIEDWERYRAGRSPDDDSCVIVVKAV